MHLYNFHLKHLKPLRHDGHPDDDLQHFVGKPTAHPVWMINISTPSPIWKVPDSILNPNA